MISFNYFRLMACAANCQIFRLAAFATRATPALFVHRRSIIVPAIRVETEALVPHLRPDLRVHVRPLTRAICVN